MTLSGPRSVVMLGVLWLAALGSAAGVVWAKHRSRELFIELQKLQVQRDTLEIEAGQLLLEQSAWSAHAFVEQIATQRLHMVTPPQRAIDLVQP
jgi:cell division protein FtsL